MPFVANAQDNEEEKQDQPNSSQGAVAPVGGSGAVRLSPSSGVASTGGGGTSGAGTPTSGGASGGQFASLNQYLNANQGQATPLAGKITGGINDQYNALNNQDTSVLSGINSQVGAAATPSNYNDTIAQESTNPVSFASNPGNVASFQNLLNASYAGPASAESTTDYTNQQNAINSAISAGQNATGTEAGREGLLSQNEATPTTGVTALNSAILSQDPTALNSIETAYQPFSGLLNNLQTGAGTIDQQIAQNQMNAAGANTAANTAISGQINDLNNALTTTATQDQANQAAYNAELAQVQGQYNPLSTAINSVNEVDKQYAPSGPTITNPFEAILASPVSNISYTPQNVATQDQINQGAAFQNLINGLTGLPTPTINTPGQANPVAAPPTLAPLGNPQTLASQIYQQEMAANNADWATQANKANPSQGYINAQPNFATLTNLLDKLYPGMMPS